MEFTLHYRGNLKANGTKEDKHLLRKYFHNQLKELWNHVPLCDYQDLKEGLIQEVGRFKFLPLISRKIAFTAEIKIFMLRPGIPGSIVTEGGDIDNRLKTLFDSLRVPDNVSAIPENAKPEEVEELFYCLLEDDKLITKVSVDTDRFLDPSFSSNHVEMFIHVATKKHKDYISTSGL